ncbi:hypothetical protein [Limnohabitans sp. JirII-29]|uniref:hypothetical protein n=1 Tax=Limnohabitans sp. JirII-29 TaxID=1835756 RepID=UPI0011B20D61|nr:hypothetical protein [Limnohabitans sp. JirII-29]
MSNLEKSFWKLLFEAARKQIPPPHFFPISGVLSAIGVATFLSNSALFTPLQRLLVEGEEVPALVLFGAIVTLAIAYLIAALSELLWARQYWKELIPAPDMSQLVLPVFISGAMAVMAYLVPNIKAFSLAYLVYCMMDTSGCVLYLQTIGPSLEKARASGKVKYASAEFQSVLTFYRHRWWLRLHLVKLLFALIGVSVQLSHIEVKSIWPDDGVHLNLVDTYASQNSHSPHSLT